MIKDYQAAMEEGVRTIPAVIFPATGQALVGLTDPAQYRATIEDAAGC